MNSPGLSFVIPAYNEENAIAPTVQRLQAVLAGLGLDYEIIVVNDGSRDATRERAAACGGDVRVISHPVNIGYGSALKSGICAARYDWVGIVDADGTYDIEQLPLLVEKMREGFDMAVAARKNVLSLDKPVKRFFRRLLINFLNVVIGARIEDPNSGFRIFSRSMAERFLPFLCNTFSFTTSITVFALGQRHFVCYVPMHYTHRTGKSKVRHFRDSLRMMQLVFQGITFYNPVKFYLMMVLGVGVLFLLPALMLAAFGLPMAAGLWFAFGALASVLVGLGTLGDIIRIAELARNGHKWTIND